MAISQSDKAKELRATLDNLIENFKEKPEEIVELIAFKNRFYNYSVNNNILIYSQNPYATYVASYEDWKKKGYQVQRNQHGIKIIFPMRTEIFEVGEKDGKKIYRRVADANPEEKAQIKSGAIKPFSTTRFGVGNVFDISQTDCPAEDYPKLFHMGYSSDQHAAVYDAFKSYCLKRGTPVNEVDLHSIALRGQFSPLTGEIQISDKLDDTEKLSTLTHEFGHALLHGDRDSAGKNTSIKELEADCISIMLQQEFGIDLTESRKKHFVDHYNVCKGLEDFSLEDTLKSVSTAYLKLRKELDPVIEAALTELPANKSQYGTLDITDLQKKFDVSNYLAPKKALYLIQMGVPIGSISDFDSQNNRIEKYDEPVGEIHTMYLPINSVDGLAEHNVQHFESMTIHPNFMNTTQMQHYMYVMDMLMDKKEFTPEEVSSFEKTFLDGKPFTYEKMMDMRDKFITEEKITKWADFSDGSPDLIKKIHAFIGLDSPADKKENNISTDAIIYDRDVNTKIPTEDKVLKALKENFPGLKSNAGYFILDEVPGYALGFNPKAPDALVLWSASDGEYRNGIYRHTLEGFGLHDLVDSGLHVHQINVMLLQCGYDDMQQDMATERPVSAKEPDWKTNEPAPAPEPKQNGNKKEYQDFREQDAAVLDYIKRGVSILRVAEDMGFTPVQTGGYYTLKEHDSVRFYTDTNSFHRFSADVGGSAIDFVMHFGGMNEKEAIQSLKEKYVGDRLDSLPQYTPPAPVPAPKAKVFELPEKADGKFARSFAYLTKTRCLDSGIVQQCMKDGLIYEDNKHNVVFVAADETGKPAYATRHTTLTNSDFKRDVAGSRQDIGWIINNKADRLYVTEAPIDAMSIMCLRKHQGKTIADADYMATCGTGKDAALYFRLKQHPYKEIILANDNDEAGQKANRKIYEQLRTSFPDIKISCIKPKGKDVNEHLCKFCAENCTPKNPKKAKAQEVER